MKKSKKKQNDAALRRANLYRIQYELDREKSSISTLRDAGYFHLYSNSEEEAKEEFLLTHNNFGLKFKIISTYKLKS